MKLRAAWLLLPLALPTAATAQGFATFNQSTLTRSTVLPSLTSEAPLAVGGRDTRITLDWSNESFGCANAREQLLIDAETQRLSLQHRRAFAQTWEWSAELPLIASGGGVLDTAIEGWHSAFALPNSNRDQRPQNRYRIRYVRDGEVLLDLDEGRTGLGDVRLGLAHTLSPQWQLRTLVQLPTGSRSHLTGGHAGAALWAVYGTALGATQHVGLQLAAGASAAQTQGPLSDQQRKALLLGSAALSAPLPWFDTLQAVTQLSLHSAPYRGSALSPLDKASAQLSFGVRQPFTGGLFELAVMEDLAVSASPDFGLHLSLRLTP